MLDIGWSELLVVAVVLIVVVGPKDLPPMLRAFGKMTSRLRKTAGEFRHQFDEALRESELDDVRKTISDVRSLNPANAVRDAVNPLRKMGEEIKADLKNATTVPKDAKTNAGTSQEPAPLPEMPSPLPPVDSDMLKEAAPAVPAAKVEASAGKVPAAPRKAAVRKAAPTAATAQKPATKAVSAAAPKATRAKSATAGAAESAPKARKPATRRKKDQE